ncbi:Oxygen-Regulated Protein 1 [Manis pentadactyla]|nr:Oxygen-Regulated Protein 1 [Manis pentadactyla]
MCRAEWRSLDPHPQQDAAQARVGLCSLASCRSWCGGCVHGSALTSPRLLRLVPSPRGRHSVTDLRESESPSDLQRTSGG